MKRSPTFSELVLMVVACAVFCFVTGCANAKYRELDRTGNVIKEMSITYPIWGSRQTRLLDIDMKKGKVKLGSLDRNGGAVGRTLENTSETLLNISKKGGL